MDSTSEYYYTPTRSYHPSFSDPISSSQAWTTVEATSNPYSIVTTDASFEHEEESVSISSPHADGYLEGYRNIHLRESGRLNYHPSSYAAYAPPAPVEHHDMETEGHISSHWESPELSPTVHFGPSLLSTHGGRASLPAALACGDGFERVIDRYRSSTDPSQDDSAHRDDEGSDDAAEHHYPGRYYTGSFDISQYQYASSPGIEDQCGSLTSRGDSVKVEEDEHTYATEEDFTEGALWNDVYSYVDVKPPVDPELLYSPDIASPDSLYSHDRWPLPQTSRSYTLADAMAEPRPRTPQHRSPIPKQEVLESPPMASLQLPATSRTPKPQPLQPRPRGRPRKIEISVNKTRSDLPVAYPRPELLSDSTGSSASTSGLASCSPSHSPDTVIPSVFGQVPMSLDEIPIADRDIKPGQSIFKLNTASADKEPVKKKPIMACLFCRERKIACGPALPGNQDQRCNQCARRSLHCVYPKESRRGQHKRGPRAAKDATASAASRTGDADTQTRSSSSTAGPSTTKVRAGKEKPQPGKERERSASRSRTPRDPQLAAARRAVYRQQHKLAAQAQRARVEEDEEVSGASPTSFA
ncbi:hypothetical protein CERSUDRAFT_114621 [Gelatoporia subvermispora B]|uniref:Zn(2)-C6 fungal-type domain-containing protein n=1 Tax=Ceriporiopsis subvermispora (strain B) TaxID=914234 RepID=M2QHZ7_CERS8|nr:hypothetical protein CERSUDRAFT_114621 [Gelatoporia subvermispora B]